MTRRSHPSVVTVRNTRRYAPAWCVEAFRHAGGCYIVVDEQGRFWRATRTVWTRPGKRKARVRHEVLIPQFGPCRTLNEAIR